MPAAELLFMGGHVSHINAYYERMRMQRIEQEHMRFVRTNRRRLYGRR